jgi:hypothetical protein
MANAAESSMFGNYQFRVSWGRLLQFDFFVFYKKAINGNERCEQLVAKDPGDDSSVGLDWEADHRAEARRSLAIVIVVAAAVASVNVVEEEDQ